LPELVLGDRPRHDQREANILIFRVLLQDVLFLWTGTCVVFVPLGDHLRFRRIAIFIVDIGRKCESFGSRVRHNTIIKMIANLYSGDRGYQWN
jgi:hypothetical protein